MIDIIVRYKYNDRKSYIWEIYKDVYVCLSDGVSITISKGFETDFASVPRFLWSFIPPIGKFNFAALIHDYCYVTKYKHKELGVNIARRWADREFLHWLNLLSPEKKIRNYTMYIAVRLFGGSHYKK